MSTWKLSNRRGFAVLERLGELAGTGIVLADEEEMPSGLSDAQRAMALAEVGDFCLALVIDTATNGKAKRLWKAMSAESGAAAAVFLAHGLAATTARLASAPNHHLSVARQDAARALMRSHLPWTTPDDDEIAGIERSITPEDAGGLDEARVRVAFGAISRVIGEAEAYGLPGLAPLADHSGDPADRYVSGLSWQICWNHVLPRWLAVTDSEGLKAG